MIKYEDLKNAIMNDFGVYLTDELLYEMSCFYINGDHETEMQKLKNYLCALSEVIDKEDMKDLLTLNKINKCAQFNNDNFRFYDWIPKDTDEFEDDDYTVFVEGFGWIENRSLSKEFFASFDYDEYHEQAKSYWFDTHRSYAKEIGLIKK